MGNTNNDVNAQIQATKVNDADRLDMMPRYFGHTMMQAEATIFSYMDKFCGDYNGGYWDFFELSNGGFFMAPSSDKKVRFEVPQNYFSECMSYQAAGMIACLFTYSHLSHLHAAPYAARFHQLREYAGQHEAAALIFRAID